MSACARMEVLPPPIPGRLKESATMRLPEYPYITVRDFFVKLYKEIVKDDVPSLAAQMAYYFLFSMFPMMLFLVALLGFLPIEDLTSRFLAQIQPVVPREFYQIIADHVHGVVDVQRPGLLSISAIVALYSASAGVNATIQALNRAYEVHDRRGFFKVKLISLGLTLAGSVLVLVATTLIVGGNAAATWIGAHFGIFGGWYELIWKAIQYLMAPAAILLALAFLYYFGPDVKQEWKWVTPGSVVATITWLIATWGFSFYVSSFGNFNATYGSLGGVMVTMLWLYLSSLVLLVGGEINAVLEHAAPEGKDEGERAPGVEAAPAERPEISGKPADAPSERAKRESPDRESISKTPAVETDAPELELKHGRKAAEGELDTAKASGPRSAIGRDGRSAARKGSREVPSDGDGREPGA